jgi:hypothetical protein
MPDSSGLWRYVSITLLMLAMLACFVWNGIQAIRRYHRHGMRMAEIHKYYESSLNPVLLTSPDLLHQDPTDS